MSRWPESRRFWIVIGCINIAIPAFTIWKMHTDDLGRVAALYTCWVSFVLLNAVCLLGMWSREHRAGRFVSRMRTVQGIAFALITAIAATFAVNSYAARNSYFALAMSSMPLESIRPARRRIVVELIRERAASSKAYQSAAAHFRPISPPLYSPRSFATVDAMKTTVQQLQQAFDMDASYADRVKQRYARFCDEMGQADPQYLREWQSARNNQEQTEASLFSVEERWFQSVQDLYGYAAGQHESIVVRNDNLAFSSPEVKAQFENLENMSRDLQQKLQTSRAALVNKQGQSVARITN
jgi:hypothetical protein